MLNCDGNENSKKKKTTTTTFVIIELRFPPHWARGRGGESTQQSVILADSALIVQSITI